MRIPRKARRATAVEHPNPEAAPAATPQTPRAPERRRRRHAPNPLLRWAEHFDRGEARDAMRERLRALVTKHVTVDAQLAGDKERLSIAGDLIAVDAQGATLLCANGRTYTVGVGRVLDVRETPPRTPVRDERPIPVPESERGAVSE